MSAVKVLVAVTKVDSMVATGRILHCCDGVAQAAQSNLHQSIAVSTLDEYVLPRQLALSSVTVKLVSSVPL